MFIYIYISTIHHYIHKHIYIYYDIEEYFENHHGDWLAVDFKAKAARAELSEHFKVESIPGMMI